MDYATAVIDPWRRYLDQFRVNIRLNQPVRGLKISGKSVDGITNHEEKYDQVIIAADIPGLKHILEGSVGLDVRGEEGLERMRAHLQALETAPHYAVLRVGFDKLILADAPFYKSVIETPQHRPINLIAIYSKLERDSIAWSHKWGGSIIEFHLYDTPQFRNASAEEIWRHIAPIAAENLPEINHAKAVSFSLGSYENFTSFESEQATIRPVANSPAQWGIENLFFAGDWVKSHLPSALMENAVVTGREAVNHILIKDNVRQIPIKAAPVHGPGILPKW